MVAVSILILRYIPPNEVPMPTSLQQSIDSVSLHFKNQENDEKKQKSFRENSSSHEIDDEVSIPLIKQLNQDKIDEEERRKMASTSIASVVIGVLTLTSSVSFLSSWMQYIGCSIGGLIFLAGLGVLCWIDQDDGRHSFGHTGGFICPFVPLLPTMCILINAYLLINLGAGTWSRVSVWLVIGVFVYVFYGRKNSSL